MGRKGSSRPPKLVSLGVAFTAGWVIMTVEILGGRMLSPYFGYSIYQWGALIGVVLAALACGYYLGGRVGDTPHASRSLAWSLIVSAGFILLVPPLGASFLPDFRAYGPAWGAVVAAGLLLAPPCLLLAGVAPVIVRLTVTDSIANTAGLVYAVSTVGSIGGTFFTAFYSIPTLGTTTSHYVAAALTLSALVAFALATRTPRYLVSVGLLGLVWLPAGPRPLAGLVLYEESIHNIIQVTETRGTRYLFLNFTDGPQTVMRTGQLLTDTYYDYFLLGPRLNQARTVLFLGVAGGTALKQLVTVYPEVEVVGVEIDGKVIDVANRYFGLAGLPRITLVESDARWYLESHVDRYDMIGIDLYVANHVPFFCTTREFFGLVKRRLTERGLMMMNVFSKSGEDLIEPLIRTVGSVFPEVAVVGRGNFIVIAGRRPMDFEGLFQDLDSPGVPALQQVIQKARQTLRTSRPEPRWPIFTDDLNDVEFRTFRTFYGDNRGPRGRRDSLHSDPTGLGAISYLSVP